MDANRLLDRHHRGDWGSIDDEDKQSNNQALLFVPLKGATHLIDGWHRLLKALLTGVETLPAYLLTQAEADCILVARVPAQAKGRKRSGQ